MENDIQRREILKSAGNQWIILFPMLLQAAYWGMLKVALPILPQVSTIFNTSDHTVHLMLSASFILSGMSSILWGPMISGASNKRLIFSIAMVSIVFMIGLSCAHSFVLFGLLYVASCIILNGLSIYSRAFPVLYLSSPELIKRSLLFRLFGGFTAAFVAPLLSGFICYFYGWRYLFGIIIAWLLFLCLVTCFMGEGKKQEKSYDLKEEFVGMLSHFKNRKFLYYLGILCCANGLAQSYVVSIPFWLEDAYQVSIQHIGFYLFPLLLPGMRLPLLPSYIAKTVSERTRTFLYMTFIVIGGIIPFVLIQLNHPPAWVWVLPGFFINLGNVGMAPFINYNAVAQVEKLKNAASTLLSIFSYVSGGIVMLLTLKIRIQDFYWEGALILSLAALMIYLIKKSGQL